MKKLLYVILAFMLIGATCEGSSDSAATGQETVDGDDQRTGNDSSSDETETTTDDESEPKWKSVFPLPPIGEINELFPYSRVESDVNTVESATFLLAGNELDAVIAFYQLTLEAMGYTVTPLELGPSIALNASDPDDPSLTAVVQVGPVSPTDPTLQVHQERNVLKVAAGSDAAPEPDATSAADATSD